MWLLESTAAWIEDEVFDDDNDNQQYLATGRAAQPSRTSPSTSTTPPQGSQTSYTPYGDWVFWKYLLGETYSPDDVRRVWTRAALDGQYSLSATRHVLTQRGHHAGRSSSPASARSTATPARCTTRAATTRRPRWPRRSLMSPDRLVQKPLQARMTQLSNLTVRYKPKDTLTRHPLRCGSASTWRRPTGARPPPSSCTSATARSRATRCAWTPPAPGGCTVPFTRSRVGNVELTLTDASGRFDCSARDYRRACHGTPKDDGVLAAFTASVVR